MISTIQDVYYLVVTICILGIAGLFGYLLIVLIRLMRSSLELIQHIQQRFDELFNKIEAMRNMIERSLTPLGLMNNAMDKILNFIEKKVDDKKTE
jgi:predicted PurR-regulated permease PerM